jgi:hypothetical protein
LRESVELADRLDKLEVLTRERLEALERAAGKGAGK